ncbi:MAG TPA: NAD-dependent epimerase/dehydratase family protein, partial [Gemmatimonadetes bacterium]|nr:NAD-dependent epimerase/dehydratase family protein [Gemmatimonadota bacterium]
MRKALVLGSNGQLGTDVILHSPETWEVIPHLRSEWDVTNDGGLEYLSGINPDVIINTTAFHNVDECEKNPELARSVNRDAVEGLAIIAESIGAILVHISTDYVFGNSGSENYEPFTESSVPSPMNIYGKSKLEG